MINVVHSENLFKERLETVRGLDVVRIQWFQRDSSLSTSSCCCQLPAACEMSYITQYIVHLRRDYIARVHDVYFKADFVRVQSNKQHMLNFVFVRLGTDSRNTAC